MSILIPTKPSSDKRIDCYLKIHNELYPFWADFNCTVNRVKKCLYDSNGMDPDYTKLYFNGLELIQEKRLIDYDITTKSVIVVETSVIQQLNILVGGKKTLYDIIDPIFSDKCIKCNKALISIENLRKFIPCGHVCICYDCHMTVFDCPLCQ